MKEVRVRFAPSPSGQMHLGNIRAAVMNYVFAKKNTGTMVLRIEDTDAEKSKDEFKRKIVRDLEWLGISYQEGPVRGGSFGPYLQSERKKKHQEALLELNSTNRIYRCFCSKERLEELKDKQISEKHPPRYDRKCLGMPQTKLNAKLEAKIPFIWRFRVDQTAKIEVLDLVKGTVSFDMKNFTDFAITRQDGSFTFLFTNFADDWKMDISHVIRGVDHFSNSASQIALFHAFEQPAPIFFHLPIICDQENKKLSKRAKSFCLGELKTNGFLPEAITNYLATLGNKVFSEIATLEEIAKNFDPKKLSSQDSVRYDVEKLKWFNNQWIRKKQTTKLIKYICEANQISLDTDAAPKLSCAIEKNKTEAKTLVELWQLSKFAIANPDLSKTLVSVTCNTKTLKQITEILIGTESSTEAFEKIRTIPKELNIAPKNIFTSIRIATTGKKTGLEIKDILEILGVQTTIERINGLRILLEKKNLKEEVD